MNINWTNVLFTKIFEESGKDIVGITEILNKHAKNIDMNKRYHSGKTILMICAIYKCENVGLLLLEYIEKGELNYERSANSEGYSDLWYAIANDSNKMAEKMISTSFFIKGENLGHILGYCIMEGNIDMYYYIVHKNLPIDFCSIIPIYNKTLLMIMLSTNSENEINKLIDTFKNKESLVDNDGHDALWYAVKFN
jgi:hypothetical protein